MAGTRIEQLIEDIYAFIENCKMQPLSQTKVIVPKDELYDLLDELRLRTPDEIKRYQKIIANRDAIMAQAEANAQAIQNEAREKAKSLIDENEIMQQAYAQANDLVQTAMAQASEMRQSAERDAEQIRTGALAYTNDILNEVEKILTNAYNESKDRSENLVASLKINLDILRENQSELRQQLMPESAQQDGGNYDEDFDIPDGAFAKEAGI